MARTRQTRRRRKRGSGHSPQSGDSPTQSTVAVAPVCRGPSFVPCELGCPSTGRSTLFPPGILRLVLQYLSARDLGRIAPTSHTWNNTSNADSLWEAHFRSDFDPTLAGPQAQLIKAQYVARLQEHHDRREQHDEERKRYRAQLARGRARDFRNRHVILNIIPEHLWVSMPPSDLNNLLGMLYAGCLLIVGVVLYLLRAVLYTVFTFLAACVSWWLPLASELLVFLLPVLGLVCQILQDDVRSFLPFELLRFYREPWMWTAAVTAVTVLREVLFPASVPLCVLVFLLRAVPLHYVVLVVLGVCISIRVRTRRRPYFSTPLLMLCAGEAALMLLYFTPALKWRPSLLIALYWCFRVAALGAVSVAAIAVLSWLWNGLFDSFRHRSLRMGFRNSSPPTGPMVVGPVALGALVLLELLTSQWLPPLLSHSQTELWLGLLHVLRAVGAVIGFFWFPFAIVTLVGFALHAPWSHDADLGTFVACASVVIGALLLAVQWQVDQRQLDWITVWKHFALSYVEPPPLPPACNLFTEAVFDMSCPWATPPSVVCPAAAAATPMSPVPPPFFVQ